MFLCVSRGWGRTFIWTRSQNGTKMAQLAPAWVQIGPRLDQSSFQMTTYEIRKPKLKLRWPQRGFMSPKEYQNTKNLIWRDGLVGMGECKRAPQAVPKRPKWPQMGSLGGNIAPKKTTYNKTKLSKLHRFFPYIWSLQASHVPRG